MTSEKRKMVGNSDDDSNSFKEIRTSDSESEPDGTSKPAKKKPKDTQNNDEFDNIKKSSKVQNNEFDSESVVDRTEKTDTRNKDSEEETEESQIKTKKSTLETKDTIANFDDLDVGERRNKLKNKKIHTENGSDDSGDDYVDKNTKNAQEIDIELENDSQGEKQNELESDKESVQKEKNIFQTSPGNELGDEKESSDDECNKKKQRKSKNSIDREKEIENESDMSVDEVLEIKKILSKPNDIDHERDPDKFHTEKIFHEIEEDTNENSNLERNISKILKSDSTDSEDDENSSSKPTRAKFTPKRKRNVSGNSSSDSTKYKQEVKKQQIAKVSTKEPVVRLTRCVVPIKEAKSKMLDSEEESRTESEENTNSEAEARDGPKPREQAKDSEGTSDSEDDFKNILSNIRNKQKKAVERKDSASESEEEKLVKTKKNVNVIGYSRYPGNNKGEKTKKRSSDSESDSNNESKEKLSKTNNTKENQIKGYGNNDADSTSESDSAASFKKLKKNSKAKGNSEKDIKEKKSIRKRRIDKKKLDNSDSESENVLLSEVTKTKQNSKQVNSGNYGKVSKSELTTSKKNSDTDSTSDEVISSIVKNKEKEEEVSESDSEDKKSRKPKQTRSKRKEEKSSSDSETEQMSKEKVKLKKPDFAQRTGGQKLSNATNMKTGATGRSQRSRPSIIYKEVSSLDTDDHFKSNDSDESVESLLNTKSKTDTKTKASLSLKDNKHTNKITKSNSKKKDSSDRCLKNITKPKTVTKKKDSSDSSDDEPLRDVTEDASASSSDSDKSTSRMLVDKDNNCHTVSDSNSESDEKTTKKNDKIHNATDSDVDSDASTKKIETSGSAKKNRTSTRKENSDSPSDSEGEKSSNKQNSQHTLSSSDSDESNKKTKSKATPLSKKTNNKKKSSDSSDSDSSDTKNKKSKKPVSKKNAPENNTRIKSLKRYLQVAGIRVNNFAKLWENCKTIKAKGDALLQLLEKEGLKGRPTIAKCERLRQKIETRNEVNELDVRNIVEESGDSSSSSYEPETVPLSKCLPVRNAVRGRKEEGENLKIEELQRQVLIEQLNLFKLQRKYYERKLKIRKT